MSPFAAPEGVVLVTAYFRRYQYEGVPIAIRAASVQANWRELNDGVDIET